jgi:hypothetical protein
MKILSLFFKKPKQDIKNVPVFKIRETKNSTVDFEVSEISYEEYKNTNTIERRLKIRHPVASRPTKPV